MCIRVPKNETGSGLVGAIALTLIVGFIGFSVLDVSSSDASSTTNEMQGLQATQIANAGLQYALEKLDNGLDPTVSGKALNPGHFSVASLPDVGRLDVTGNVGLARKNQSISAKFAKDCVSVDATTPYYDDKELLELEIKKSCNTAAILTAVTVDWNWGLCAQNLTCTGTTGMPNPSPDPDAGKVTICHIPPGNPARLHTITVGQASLPAHVAHGDMTGACAGETATNVVDCRGYEAEVNICGPNDGTAKVREIAIEGAPVATNLAAARGTKIDITDVALNANRAYKIDHIAFDKMIPEQTWYSVTFHFADGSAVKQSFKFSDD